MATLLLFLWFAVKAGDWLRARLGEEALTVANVVVWIAVVMMSYSAVGELWQRSKLIRTGYEKLAEPTAHPDIDRVYFEVLTELKSPR